MKKNVLLHSSILALTSLLVFSSCGNRPNERPAVMDPKAAANIVAIKDIAEVTNASSKNVVVSTSEKDSVKALDATFKQIKLEGTAIDGILKRVKKPDTRAALDAQLKTGAVALVVLKDQIKVLKVTDENKINLNYDVLPLRYITDLKALNKTADIQAQSSLQAELGQLKYMPADKYNFVELTTIKITKFGTLDNERTDYNEKKSLLNVVDSPFDMATHVVLGDESGYVKPASDDGSDSQ
ncbi:MAG: hypothetical protein ACXVAX_04760 [Pseudobdellovibrio sp.]